MITITCTGAMAYTVFGKTFHCRSNKCLYGYSGAAALIDTFYIGTGNVWPAGVKSALT